MKIRVGKRSDKSNYLKIQKEVFPKTDINREKKFFDLKLKNKEIFVLEERGYVGHICFGSYPLSPPFGDSIFIEEFAIKKKFQGKGFGTLLIKELKRYCKKRRISYIYLGTNDKKNNKAIKFYKRLGFKRLGKLKNIECMEEYPYGQLFYGLIVK